MNNSWDLLDVFIDIFIFWPEELRRDRVVYPGCVVCAQTTNKNIFDREIISLTDVKTPYTYANR